MASWMEHHQQRFIYMRIMQTNMYRSRTWQLLNIEALM